MHRIARIDRFPWLALACTAGLLLIGLSAIERGDEIAGSGNFAAKQAVWATLSLTVVLVATLIPYRTLKQFGPWLFLAAVLLLVAVYFMPARNGARRWIPLGPIFFQPSELAKLAFIMAIAQYLTFRESHRRLWGLIPPFLFAFVPSLLIVRVCRLPLYQFNAGPGSLRPRGKSHHRARTAAGKPARRIKKLQVRIASQN